MNPCIYQIQQKNQPISFSARLPQRDRRIRKFFEVPRPLRMQEFPFEHDRDLTKRLVRSIAIKRKYPHSSIDKALNPDVHNAHTFLKAVPQHLVTDTVPVNMSGKGYRIRPIFPDNTSYLERLDFRMKHWGNNDPVQYPKRFIKVPGTYFWRQAEQDSQRFMRPNTKPNSSQFYSPELGERLRKKPLPPSLDHAHGGKHAEKSEKNAGKPNIQRFFDKEKYILVSSRDPERKVLRGLSQAAITGKRFGIRTGKPADQHFELVVSNKPVTPNNAASILGQINLHMPGRQN